MGSLASVAGAISPLSGGLTAPAASSEGGEAGRVPPATPAGPGVPDRCRALPADGLSGGRMKTCFEKSCPECRSPSHAALVKKLRGAALRKPETSSELPTVMQGGKKKKYKILRKMG